MIYSNKEAVIGLPIVITVALIVTSIIIAMFAVGLSHFLQDTNINKVITEVDRIVSKAETMFEYADEGSIEQISVEFPPSLKYIVFGALPKNNTEEPTDFRLDENTSNNYYIVLDDETFFSFHSPVRFSGFDPTSIAVLHKGNYILTLELVQYKGKTYVKIYS